MSFKRNQIEGTLHALLSGPPRHARHRLGQEIPQRLLTRIKRLLEIDLDWGRRNTHRLGEHGMAFYDELPSGRGTDAAYSAYRTMNLAVALELLRFGCKQQEVVEKIALIQDELKTAFERATKARVVHGSMRQTDATTIQLPTTPNRSGRRQPRPDPTIFLVLRRVEAGDKLAVQSGGTLDTDEELLDHEICFGFEQLFGFVQQQIPIHTNNVFIIELSELASRIIELLNMQPVRTRGRQ